MILQSFNDTRVFFFADSDISASLEKGGLWEAPSPPNSSNVSLVRDIFPGNQSMAEYLTVSHDTLFFAAQGSVDNIELWKSDGTSTLVQFSP